MNMIQKFCVVALFLYASVQANEPSKFITCAKVGAGICGGSVGTLCGVMLFYIDAITGYTLPPNSVMRNLRHARYLSYPVVGAYLGYEAGVQVVENILLENNKDQKALKK